MRIVAVVPSLGQSPWQTEMLTALRAELATHAAALIWVHQGTEPAPQLSAERERLIRLPQPCGFAAAVNAGIAAIADVDESDALAAIDAIAVVNDDLIVSPGWLAALTEGLAARPQAAAVQGMNLELDRPERIEGCGLEWNRSWQAVQTLAGSVADAALAPLAAPFEIFGVSATAALYRRSALVEVAENGTPLRAFDERLGSYYEDVELAVRLRAADWQSWCIPAARARHAGQATAGRRPLSRWRSIYRNRLLVVHQLLGARFLRTLPRLAVRDLRDFARALLSGDAARAPAILMGWWAALVSARRSTDSSGIEHRGSARALAAAERLRIGSSG
ncbi:MAG: glycosyltransferase [Thermoanaerobaculia bacterium]